MTAKHVIIASAALLLGCSIVIGSYIYNHTGSAPKCSPWSIKYAGCVECAA